MDPKQPLPPGLAVPSPGQQLAPAALLAAHCMPYQLQQLAEMSWRLAFDARLGAGLEAIQAKFQGTDTITIAQTWVAVETAEPPGPNNMDVTLYADTKLAVVMDPLFNDLRAKSCQGPVFFRNSMPGKVWLSGSVQIVQNLKILPPTLHPRSQLTDEALERLAEALYIPVFDLTRPNKGLVCVLEVLLSSRATDMLVADVISFIGNVLSAVQLSLANPVQQPIRRSVLCGRRARAPDSDGEGSDAEMAAGRQAAKRHVQQQQQQAPSQGGHGVVPQRQDGAAAHQQAATQPQADGAAVASSGAPPGAGAGCSGSGGAGAGQQAAGEPAVVAAAAGPSGAGLVAEAQLCGLPGAPSPGGFGTPAHPTTVPDPTEGPTHQQQALEAPSSTAGALAPAAGAAPGACLAAQGQPGDQGQAASAGAAKGAAMGATPAACAAPAGGQPACSEQPTLPASPARMAHGDPGEGAGQGPSGSGSGAVPRAMRAALEGAMMRSKSTVSVAGLSDVTTSTDNEEGEPGEQQLGEEHAGERPSAEEQA